MTMNLRDWLLLIALSVLWGGSFFFAEVALLDLPPFTVVLGRVALAALALNILVVATGHRMPGDLGIWSAFLVMGTINNVIPFSLIVWGQTEITGGLASILNGTTPLFAVILAHFFTSDEKLTGYRFAGVVIGFLGVIFMIGPAALADLGVEVLAQLAILMAALAYGFASIFGKRFKGLPPIVTASGQVTCSTLLMIPLVLMIDRPWALPTPGMASILAVVGIALLSTALAYILYFRILASAGATNLMLVTFLIPISALLLGAAFLDEQVTLAQLVGMAAIGIGLALIDGRPMRWARRLIQTPKTEHR